MELEAFLQVAMDVAMQAGNIIRSSFHAVKEVEHKGQLVYGSWQAHEFLHLRNCVACNPLRSDMDVLDAIAHDAEYLQPMGEDTREKVDLVTETDKACERLIFEQIRKAFPDHKLIGEETTALTGSLELTDAPTWIIDPLDGTTNFVHSFPFVCVSIALAMGKVPVVAVVYNPIMNEMFTATKGCGAFLNGKPIATSSQKSMGVALLASGVGTKRDKVTVDAITNRINYFLYKVRSVRMVGSCALNLCGVACGRVDIFFDVGFGGPWDVAAGVLVVQEAGGEVFLPTGENFDFGSRSIAASNGYLKDGLVEAFKQTLQG